MSYSRPSRVFSIKRTAQTGAFQKPFSLSASHLRTQPDPWGSSSNPTSEPAFRRSRQIQIKLSRQENLLAFISTDCASIYKVIGATRCRKRAENTNKREGYFLLLVRPQTYAAHLCSRDWGRCVLTEKTPIPIAGSRDSAYALVYRSLVIFWDVG